MILKLSTFLWSRECHLSPQHIVWYSLPLLVQREKHQNQQWHRSRRVFAVCLKVTYAFGGNHRFVWYRSVILEFWFSFPCVNVTVCFFWDNIALGVQKWCFIEVVGPIRITTFVVLNKRLDDQSSVCKCDHIIFLPSRHRGSRPTEMFSFGHSLSVHFVSYLFFCYCGAASLQRRINHCSPAGPLGLPQWCLSPRVFHHFSSFSWRTIFHLPFAFRGQQENCGDSECWQGPSLKLWEPGVQGGEGWCRAIRWRQCLVLAK